MRKEHAPEFERLLAEFASQSLHVPGSRGVHLLFPPPGSESDEYGILRSFASAADRDAFYASPFYKQWTATIDHMVDGPLIVRKLTGLEAWFRQADGGMPPRWKMAVLSWVGVWPISMAVPTVMNPWLGTGLPVVIRAGLIAAGIVVVLTWVGMPILVKLFHPWLHGPRLVKSNLTNSP
ncbi:MAG: antibiotic biosynthesis monooxygenase [Chthoniobacter sp.]